MPRKMTDHEKEKGTFFTCVTNDDECRKNIKEICLDFQSWAWIDHEPDTEEGKPHTHFLLRSNGTRSVKQMADKIQISPQYVQVCRKVVAFRRYMIHLDNPEKKQYKLEDIHTNAEESFKLAIEGEKLKDVNSLFRDFRLLYESRITPEEFIQQNYIEMSKMAFSQKIKTFETLLKCYGRGSRTTT